MEGFYLQAKVLCPTRSLHGFPQPYGPTEGRAFVSREGRIPSEELAPALWNHFFFLFLRFTFNYVFMYCVFLYMGICACESLGLERPEEGFGSLQVGVLGCYELLYVSARY